MANLVLNLDRLNNRHERSEKNKLKVFESLLKKCHNKIKKYNDEFKKYECLYEPPVFIFGKPPYNHNELVNYLVDNLKKNGLKIEWLYAKKSIYISWRPIDIDQEKYQSQIAQQVYHDDYNEQLRMMLISTPTPTNRPNKTSTGRKKKNDTNRPVTQHVAMLEYNDGARDLIPINVKALNRNISKK